jgi:hypothetical protein
MFDKMLLESLAIVVVFFAPLVVVGCMGHAGDYIADRTKDRRLRMEHEQRMRNLEFERARSLQSNVSS